MFKKIFLILILTAFGFILFYFGLSFFIASQLVKANHSPIGIPPESISQEYENINIKSSDGNLSGWLFKSKSEKLIIMVAGLRENRTNNTYFGSLLAKDFIDQDYNVLMYDNQATGKSDGNYVTFGVKESRDIISVVDYAKSKGFKATNIGIIGNSLGAVTILLAADNLNDIGAIIVDSPIKNLKKYIENLLQKENNIPYFLDFGVFFWLNNSYHINADIIKPVDHILKSPQRSFLFLNGALDQTNSLSETKILKDIANPNSKLIIFPNSSHADAFIKDQNLYLKTIFNYLLEHLK